MMMRLREVNSAVVDFETTKKKEKDNCLKWRDRVLWNQQLLDSDSDSDDDKLEEETPTWF